MNSCTVSHSLIGIDRLVGFFAVEKVGHQLDDTRNTGGTTDEDNLVDVGLVDLGITQDLLYGLKSTTEEILAKFFETSTGDGGVEVNALE